MPLSTQHILALCCAGKVQSSTIIRLGRAYTSFDAALAELGRHPMDLADHAAQIMQRCERHGVRVITCVDPDYPVGLERLLSQPPVLFVRGVLPTRPSVAVVGTRAHTVQYGKPVTEYLVSEWTQSGCAIISGLAQGIDTIAHDTCVRHGGYTAAVIASGIDRITPRTAQDMARRIIDAGGCIVSEHACGVKAYAPAFPARNRIIAALSAVVVVAESKAQGGALITAQMAREIGIPVYAVPGSITSTRSTGCNVLIRNGFARMLLHPGDIAEHIPLSDQQRLRRGGGSASIDTTAAASIDDIASGWSCTVAEARTRLALLELEGKVTVLPGGLYLIPP